MKRTKTAHTQTNKGFKPKWKIFCEEYVMHWNATKAYAKAYPNVTNGTASTMGHNLLKNTEIRAYMAELQTDTERLAGVSRTRVAKEYAKIAFSSIADLHNTWISRKEWELITDEQKSAIAEIQTRVLKKNIGTQGEPEIVDVEEIKIKLYDKRGALDSLTKFFGYGEPEKYAATVSHTHTIKTIPVKKLSQDAQKLLMEISTSQIDKDLIANDLSSN